MSSENVIHIRLDYMEALKAKKAVLSSELTALNIGKKIARYREIRMEELELKMKMYNKMKEIKSSIRKLQIILPNPKMPKILKEQAIEHHTGEEKVLHDENSIESQLREIQRRLERLQSE